MRVRTWHLAPRATRRGGLKLGLPAYGTGHSTRWVTHGVLAAVARTDAKACNGPHDPSTDAHVARTATPGQAGLPAEFKHINKRRRRNLQGFP